MGSFNREIEGHSLWAWIAAASIAPMAQFLGSNSWLWTLLLGLGAGGLWLLTERRAGYRPGKIVACVQILFLSLCTGAAASWSGACWLTAEKQWAIPAVLLVLAACAAEGGCQAGARCGGVLFWFLAGMFLLLGIFALPDVELRWLNPIESGRWQGAFLLLLPGVCALLPRKRKKSPWLWAVGLTLTGCAIAALTAGALSPKVAAETSGAFFQMARGISVLGVAERFEVVVAAAMTIGWFCLLSLLLSAAGHMAESMHEGWGRPAVWLTALLAGLTMPWMGNLIWPVLTVPALVLWYLVPVLGRRKEK